MHIRDAQLRGIFGADVGGCRVALVDVDGVVDVRVSSMSGQLHTTPQNMRTYLKSENVMLRTIPANQQAILRFEHLLSKVQRLP